MLSETLIVDKNAEAFARAFSPYIVGGCTPADVRACAPRIVVEVNPKLNQPERLKMFLDVRGALKLTPISFAKKPASDRRLTRRLQRRNRPHRTWPATDAQRAAMPVPFLTRTNPLVRKAKWLTPRSTF